MNYLAALVGYSFLIFAAMACKDTEKGSLYESESGLAAGVSYQVEDQRTPEYKAFAEAIRSVKTPDDINRLLAKLDEDYSKDAIKSKDVQFFAAQMIPLRNFRSLVYKAKPLFQKDYDTTGKLPATNATHHVAVSAVMAAVSGQKILLPYTNASAVTEFVTQPVTLDPKYDHTGRGRDAQVVEQYIDTDKIQSELLCGEFKSDMETAIDRISKIDFGSSHVTVDMALALGQNTNAFSDANHKQDRYVLVGEPERAAVLSGLMAAMHNIYVGCSYTIKDITYAIEALGWTAGMDGAINRMEVAGAPASIRFNLLRTGTIPANLKTHVAARLALQAKQDRQVSARIRNPGQFISAKGKSYMADALAHLKASAHYAYLAYLKASVGRPGTSEMFAVLDWNRWKSFDRLINLNMSKMLTMAGIPSKSISVGDKTPMPKKLVEVYLEASQKSQGARAVSFKSLVTNETTTVFMDRFYLDPPTDVRNFMPVSFDDNPASQFRAVAGGKSFGLGSIGSNNRNNNSGNAGTSRNYSWGMSTGWRNDVWGQYFQEIGKHGVRGEIRILAESLGGTPLAAAMAPFVF